MRDLINIITDSALSEDSGKMTWQPFSVPVTITLNLITHASSQEEAHRFVQQSLSGMEVEPGFGNGEQLVIDGGINAVIDQPRRALDDET